MTAALDMATQAMASSLLAYALAVDQTYRIGAHHRLLADRLEALERGDIKRLMVFMPPRHGKSRLTSEIFPAWYLGRNPHHQVLFSTYGQELADGFGRKVRNLVADPLHTSAFPECRLADDSSSIKRFNTSKDGVYYAVGAGGAITGRGADILLIDDPLKGREEADSRLMRDKLWDWYASVAYTRLMPGGRVCVVQTRWHEDDLSGRLIDREGHDWEVISLPAIAEVGDILQRKAGEALWPDQYGEAALQDIRRTIGEREFAALYQQRPTPLEGALFKREWIQRAGAFPHGAAVTLGVDLALSSKHTADYTAIVAMARDEFGKLYVIDAIRERVDFPGALRLIRLMADKHKPRLIAIEQVAYQAVVVQQLLRDTTLPVRGVTPDRDKVTRAQPLALRYEQGLIWHVGALTTFEDEMTAFPNAEHDDMVDAAAYAYLALQYAGYQRDDKLVPMRDMEFEPFDSAVGY